MLWDEDICYNEGSEQVENQVYWNFPAFSQFSGVLQSSKNEQKHNCCWNLATSPPAGPRILWMAVTTKGNFTLNTVSFLSFTSQLIKGMVSTLVMVLIHDSWHSY